MKEELKTLKDLEELFSPMKRVYGGEDFISANIIREEAKNWIKVTNEEKEQWIRGGSTCYSYEKALAVLEFIKYFFNLEDEK